MDFSGWILLAVLLAAGVYFAAGRRRSHERREVDRLIRACGGDRDLVERLIFAEMQREEGLSMSTAAMRARRRLARDRR